MADTAIIPVVEKTVDFYGDAIPVAQDAGGEIYVPLTPLSEFLGLNAQAQRRRVGRDPVMAERMRQVVLTAPDGKRYETFAIPLDLLPGWLFGVTTGKVKPQLADKLNRYRAECFRVLWQAFQDRMLPASTPGSRSLAAIAEMARSIATLAEEQMRLENRLDNAARYTRGIDIRLRVLEGKLSPPSLITNDQAAEVSNIVKALAELMTAKDSSKNHYQGIFAEIYRRFGVSSYKLIRQGQYEAVLQFLEDWRKAADVNRGAPESGNA